MPNSSSVQQPLNQAIVHQVLHNLRTGQLRKCKAMGFGDAELKAFQSPKYLSVLMNSAVTWCEVKVNSEVVQRLIVQADRTEEQNRLIDRALRLGASTALISQLFGLTNQEIKHRRVVLDVPQRRGRWPILDADTERSLWHRWDYLSKENSVDIDDPMALLDVVILLAEEFANLPLADGSVVSLSQIWSTITGWADQGLL
ncbi:hypothetical protein B2J73_18060 [Stutzerimonas stutzeri]|mgnify:FL=1|jgi:hypothetical protein|uniref:DUF2857 domain-containing protein n=1 Tax=Stutzerimonas TaxID=2901164 RepID=UPI00052CC961|nr:MULTISPECIES: DUF2857 domain-containing protein [Stutzerimonas]CEG51002.1 conserved hypothetical protein [Stutzerimonas xanthomarina]MDH0214514.1 DUF2857 domain-containing protein [Stutzerimonas stutzeri]MDH0261849.1 DUF2857 domain-containing protein [Stutzerimonas stutzeri]MDI9729132.1 DUF2857 domain-containing protein [Stutzerimonas stutzeri]MDI9750320.1 DUF2857 domain-containing protein [Stutzerimonas stutzeri]